MSFARWPFAWKIALPAVTVFVFTIVIVGISLSSLYSTMLDERLAKVSQITETAVSIAAAYHEKEVSGELSRKDAQEAAKPVPRIYKLTKSQN